MLLIDHLVLGMVSTNTYLAADSETGDCVVIDPADNAEMVRNKAEELGWIIREIWVTHAHFDHIYGIPGLAALNPEIVIRLPKNDLELYEAKGGSRWFSLPETDYPPATDILRGGDELRVGNNVLRVLDAPGHTSGHVMFYCEDENVLFSGDVIFAGSIGRTDLPGGDHQTLIQSIEKQVMSLPAETRILSGHGEETTVGKERQSNPYVGTGI